MTCLHPEAASTLTVNPLPSVESYELGSVTSVHVSASIKEPLDINEAAPPDQDWAHLLDVIEVG